MKKKKPELDVDFIQSKPLTKQQEKELSEFIQKLKNKSQKSKAKKAA